MRPIDGDRLMMHLTDWWYSSFGQSETDESKAIKTVLDKIEQSLGVFAMEQDRWIPVTERLPELESEVLVTDEYGEIRHADYSDWLGKAEFRTVEESMTLEDVKAWRPLPAPYQEDEA